MEKLVCKLNGPGKTRDQNPAGKNLWKPVPHVKFQIAEHMGPHSFLSLTV